MRRAAETLAQGLLWGLSSALVTVEALLVWAWLRGTLYVMKFGAAENPYAAEDAEIAGICALILLPPAMASLAWIVYRVIVHHRDRERIDR